MADLPGDLAAPRCLGVTEQAAEEFWLWLADLGEEEETAWLSSTADLRQRLALAEPGLAELPQVSQHPYLAKFLPADNLDRNTLCHRDAFRRNLPARPGPNGQPQTVRGWRVSALPPRRRCCWAWARHIATLPPCVGPPPLLGPSLAHNLALYRHLLALGDEALTLLAALR